MKKAISNALVVALGSSKCRVLFVFTAVLSVILAGQAFAQDLPSGGWTGSHTFGPGAEGHAVAVQRGVYEVTGNGVAIWGNSDEFHFLYKELSGDGSLICRVVDNGVGSNIWSKGGVMIRDTLEPGSANCATFTTGGGGGGVLMQWRATTGGLTEWTSGNGAIPLWIRIERTENDFSSFSSKDGINWTQIGSTQTVPMTDPVLIGFGVCAHASGELRTYTFDNVSFEGDVSGEIPPEAAQDPLPDGEAADVPRDIQLSWNPGVFAETHNVYLGTSWDDVNDASVDNPMGVLVSAGQTETSFDPNGPLDLGQTYYWRVDEVNAAPDDTIFKGWVWSFTVEPIAYPIKSVAATSNAISEEGQRPENTVNGSGLNADDEHSMAATDMWLGAPVGAEPVYIQYELDKVYRLHEMLVWNYNVQFELVLGLGLKDVTVEYSENGTDWTVLGNTEVARATATATYTPNTVIDLGGVAARCVRLTVNSGWGTMGTFGLSEVRVFHIPTRAREPQPADGQTGVSPDVILSWRTGREAVAHDVYFSTDRQAVVNGTAQVDTVTENSYLPGPLDPGQTYYWRINEINEAETVSVWEGDVWEFTTAE